ncbi:transcription factor bHLH120 [Vitis riparia]|uniref:transcription factor bHLH120 n=1 Tax=Vitis riparia TaxID=96939 RepID=UPI00155A7368|nr:transcription factor bHLH120 [Vitis riparia]
MAVLYASLRSLVPNEYLKFSVTRSVSGHIYETVNYIRHLQDKIQELSDKRDCLKKLSNTSNNVAPDCPTSCLECSSVTVEPCWAGVEVLVSTGFTQGLPLSRVLSVLTSEGLSIVSCSSTKVNGMLLHSIESEVNDGRSIDVSELQQKLADLKVKTSSKILKW